MQRIGSGFFWNQLNTLYVREGACKVHVDGQKTCGNTVRPAAAAMLIASIAPVIPPTVVASTRKMSMPLTRSETTVKPTCSVPLACNTRWLAAPR
jgi:hypothetical protein